MTNSSVEISVGARHSPLSKAQVKEVHDEIMQFFPSIHFTSLWIATRGDHDKITSLKTLDKTNFFTDEIDRRQAQGEFRIAIHSAKDLPAVLHPALEIIAITKGVDPSDALVVHELPIRYGARIGTSSERREAFLKEWRPDLQCVDIRGTIEERLQLMDDRVIDGVIIAEAALIRLKLTHRLRIPLPLITADKQGKLAIVARKNDEEMRHVFRSIDHGR